MARTATVQMQRPAGLISLMSTSDPTQPTATSLSNTETSNLTTTSKSQDFNSLLDQRDDLLKQKDDLQTKQLLKIQTEKNNTAFQNQFKSRSNLVDLMQQLLTASRRTNTAQRRVFM